MDKAKSKILVIGASGYIGKSIIEASALAGHQTFALLRRASLSDPAKAQTLAKFSSLGVNFVHGDLYDHESLLNAVKLVDVVVSTLFRYLIPHQLNIIAAIKEAGNVKWFFPSEFGNDLDCVRAVEPAKMMFANKAKIRRVIEAEGIPFRYVCSNFFDGIFLANLAQLGPVAPPRDRVVIFGDGNPEQFSTRKRTLGPTRAVDDPRTLNKILYIRPPGNIYSFDELVSLWKKTIGKTLEREYILEDQLVKNIQETPAPLDISLSIRHFAFVNGDQTNFVVEPSFGVEASELYPDVKYTTVDEYLYQFV